MNDIAQWVAVILAAACIVWLLALRRQDAAHRRLEQRVAERTAQLQAVNQELERREINAIILDSRETRGAVVPLTELVLADHDNINSILKLGIEQRRARLRDEVIQYKDEDQAHALAAIKMAEEQLLDSIARSESQVAVVRAMLEQMKGKPQT